MACSAARVQVRAQARVAGCLVWLAATWLYGCRALEPTPEPLEHGRVLVTDLAAPWEISYGPDGWLWITERVGKRVTRVHPESGVRRTALQLHEEVLRTSSQDGLLGMALHPRLLQGRGEDFVYLASTYDADPGTPLARRARIVRFTYDAQRQVLHTPLVLLDGLPGSFDHNSGRLKVGPDDTLYYTMGDQGKNHTRFCEQNRAQDLPTAEQLARRDYQTYEGKILRIALDGSVPQDNPVLQGVRSHIYSFGHRNAQGLAFGADGKLYASEHGPKTDDEINRIVAGHNYGWPHVAGFRDDAAYAYGNWSASAPVPCSSLRYDDYVLPPSVPRQRESDWNVDFTPPLVTFFTVANVMAPTTPDCEGDRCWPTIAPSSLDIIASPHNPLGGSQALLVTSLKHGSIYRVFLSADGEQAQSERAQLFKSENRYRDLTLSPDQRTLYVITDAVAATSAPTQGSTRKLAHKGAVLAFTSPR